MSIGETAARRALRENSVAASKAIRNHIDDLPLYLKEKGFISDSHYDSVMSTTHESLASKANKFLSAVEGKVDSGNDAELGRKWLEAFMTILTTQNIGEFQVAQNIAKVYGQAAPPANQSTAIASQSLDIDRDVRKVKVLLAHLDKDELKDLFLELGLFDATVLNRYSGGVSVYANDLIRSWILGKDDVLRSEVYRGGPTWGNLKKALIELNHNGIAQNIVL